MRAPNIWSRSRWVYAFAAMLAAVVNVASAWGWWASTLRCVACAFLPTNDTDLWKLDDSAYLLESEMLSLNRSE